MQRWCVTWVLVSASLLSLTSACGPVSKLTQRTWHEKFKWKAEEYFTDAQVIALCKAIEANDLAEIDRLVAAGADVNAQGKGKMTPLLWAFPDNKPERFKRLLEHRANPNVLVESDFNTRMEIESGTSVTHFASRTAFPKYFEYVFDHGGDPNLVGGRRKETPIFLLISGPVQDRRKKIETLIAKGVDLDYQDGDGFTPAMKALMWAAQFDIVLLLLKAGADPNVYTTSSNQKLVHMVILQERVLPNSTPQQVADYQKLVDWLKEHGQSFPQARADIDRWKSWASKSYAAWGSLLEREIAEREARQKREKEAAKNNKPESK